MRAGRTGAASGDLALEKVRAIRRNAKNASLSAPARAASGSVNRQHSRYSVRGVAGRRLVAVISVPQLVPMRWRTTALVAGRGNIRGSEGPETRWYRLILSGTRNLHMDSNHSAPAIVITVINDCASLWHEVLLGIEEEGILPASASPGWNVVDGAAGGAQLLRLLLVGVPAIDARWSCITEFTRIGAAFTLMHHPGQSGPS